MIDEEILKKNVESLEILAKEIQENMGKLCKSAKLYLIDVDSSDAKIRPFDSPFKELHRDTIRKYQKWYSMSLILIKNINPEKISEFSVIYDKHGFRRGEGVFNLIRFDAIFNSYFTIDDLFNEFNDKFEIQRSILLAIPDVFLINEINMRQIISSVFINREIEEAEYLYKKKYYRCAGALAGVALEQYLRFQCEKYGIDYGKKDTIEPLVQKLYSNNKIELIEMKNIQHLASIRDSCDHPSEIVSENVKELIEKVKKMV